MNVQQQLNQSISLLQQGRTQEAQKGFEFILQRFPKNADALHLLGVCLAQQGDHCSAVGYIEKALAVQPKNAGYHLNLGNSLQELGKFEGALVSFDRSIALQPNSYMAYFNRGNVLLSLGRLEDALTSYSKAIQSRPDIPDFYYNRANVLQMLKRSQESLADYQKAISLNPAHMGAYFNGGNVLQELRRMEEAIAFYDRAIAISATHAFVHGNRANALYALKRYEEAVQSYDDAIRLDPNLPELYHNRGIVLRNMNRTEEAIRSLEAALKLNPEYPYLKGIVLYSYMKICDWSGLYEAIKDLRTNIHLNKKTAFSFSVLVLTDSLSDHYCAAKVWANDWHPIQSKLGLIPKRPPAKKIRIGYFSADFHNHATTWLMAELFERHDKSCFELYAFSFGPNIQDQMRQRVAAAFDRFIDVRSMSDLEVAQLSRELAIDIAIDLKGYTEDSRLNIFSYRAAPIQVNYIGYPGTVVAPYMDYIISDHTLIPKESQQYYSEKVVYLPGSYQVNDRQRKIADRIFTRAELGLPEQGFVFCCFNNNYKITPDVFDSWVRILLAVPGSVLWLFEDNPTAAANLRKEAQQRGLDPNRLVFAKKMELSEHLARHRLADLFLDTLPYNAHTTASDALWVGLPVLTRMGESFASRVAGSLLNAIDLPELITDSPQAYEALAIQLATHPEKLNAIKAKLEQNRLTTPLFDTETYTKHLEAAYQSMYDRYQADLPPDHIEIEAQQ